MVLMAVKQLPLIYFLASFAKKLNLFTPFPILVSLLLSRLFIFHSAFP